MNAELLKTYKQLEGMNQTEEVIQIKNQIKESLYQELRYHFLELSGIGRVIEEPSTAKILNPFHNFA